MNCPLVRCFQKYFTMYASALISAVSYLTPGGSGVAEQDIVIFPSSEGVCVEELFRLDACESLGREIV